MDAKRFVNQLKRETKAHPAKAALLAIMCGVLVYVCVPKFMGTASAQAKSAADAKKAVKQENQETQGIVAVANAVVPAVGNRVDAAWQDVAEGMNADVRMKSALRFASDRDPFAPLPKPIIAENKQLPNEKQPPPAPPKVHFTPSEVGLVLSSTLLGAEHRVAMINGKPYDVYDAKQKDNRRSVVPFAIEQPTDDQAEPNNETNMNAYFVLIDVRPRSIVLWRLGSRYEMKLPGMTLADSASPGARTNPELPDSALTQ